MSKWSFPVKGYKRRRKRKKRMEKKRPKILPSDVVYCFSLGFSLYSYLLFLGLPSCEMRVML
jgi:hypothetical protein